MEANKKTFREGSRRSSRLKSSVPELPGGDESSFSVWESWLDRWTDDYEQALSNQYSTALQNLLECHSPEPRHRPTEQDRIVLATSNNVLVSSTQTSPGRIGQNCKALKATRDLPAESLIVEYRGKVMLQQQFEANDSYFRRPYPFVLYYSKLLEMGICVDARLYGNEARFVRRSCTPNAEVRHCVEDGLVHFYIYSITEITKDNEITISFDFDYTGCSNYQVVCACQHESPGCHIFSHNKLLVEGEAETQREARHKKCRNRDKDGFEQNLDSDGDVTSRESDTARLLDAKQRRLSPVRLACHQDTEHNDDEEEKPSTVSSEIEMEPEEQINERRKKMAIPSLQTREERKMEAIMQAIAKMEKREKRREQALERIGCGSVKYEGKIESKETTPETAEPPSLHPVLQVVEPEPVKEELTNKMTPARVNRSKQRRSFTRNRTHIGQQRRRNRTQSGCSEPPPSSPDTPDSLVLPTVTESQGIVPASPVSGQSDDAVVVAVATEAAVVAAVAVPVSPVAMETSLPTTPICSKGNARYPKTKKHLVSEWLSEKPERLLMDFPSEPSLRITTDPTVLATTLNSLPGLTHSPQLYTTPKHYIRFGSPFMAKPRKKKLGLDSSFGSCKKRWLKQAMDETAAVDECNSPLDHESTLLGGSGQDTPQSDSPTQSTGSHELITPLKKRRLRESHEDNTSETMPSDGGDTPMGDLPDVDADVEAFATVGCTTPNKMESGEMGTVEEMVRNGFGPVYSPVTPTPTASLPSCPAQYENISSPESSPEAKHTDCSIEVCYIGFPISHHSPFAPRSSKLTS
uniref:Lysine (K)-specific methyltransferase 2E n=1 Tax=Eptatretus burgeri TaxID=7764 RepID=A0A8C4N7U5_EPTBU